ncbi:type II toxin-antitoxin system prevent-host-death family antitoxin [Kineosporia sp. NBRC 101731]|uniref:type II toxin-antitoxin system Phd/YefM family antitoxin n=1 Tax=Kineosporia sp. NBRC 101731 TaxID=3032199 RepID=UPI00249FA83D|nr:type II toxin-antitoxin system prevent-host-death family antitoxin [Kineosporia sp. NBRC 101731]GLY32503.1 antitoxin VapB46 [Kineosporia sp. NBRC 101731]
MHRISTRELSRNTSQMLARVSSGELLEITDRGRPIARLVPVTNDQSVLARLVASGKASMPICTGPLPLPPEWGNVEVDAADMIATLRDEERW